MPMSHGQSIASRPPRGGQGTPARLSLSYLELGLDHDLYPVSICITVWLTLASKPPVGAPAGMR